MNLTTNRQMLAPAITGLSIGTDKFKTERISLTFTLPLTVEDNIKASLLSRLLARTTGSFPTPVALQRKLMSLYGARFSSHVLKLGDAQLLNISITVISDRFALQPTDLRKQAAAFLCDALFNPHVENGSFTHDNVAVCKRLLKESIESQINDKRRYAIAKMYSAMCKDEPFGIEPADHLDEIESVTGTEIFDYWQNMVTTAPVTVIAVGSEDPTVIYDEITAKFATLNRNPKPYAPTFTYRKPTEVQKVNESMPIAQGKLVMGFRSDISSMEQDNLAFRMMCDIFGGAPYSKLFTVVREKMSLCYYCAARIQSQKGLICVDSGVDNQNIEAAKAGITEQLEAMKSGDFSHDVMTASKMSIADGARSVTDSAEAIESWYLARLFDKEIISPDDMLARLNQITKEDIVKAANTVTLDTVYTLTGQEE